MANSPITNHRFGVRVYFSGQIGNQMFHYCIGKILAEKRGLSFVPPVDFVDSKGDFVKWSGEPIFRMEATPGDKFKEELAFQFGARYYMDFDALPKGPLHVCYGHWCNYGLLKPWKKTICEQWLRIPEHRFVETDHEALYIHARRTDFKVSRETGRHQGIATSLESFEQCFGHFDKFKRLVVVTDDALDPFHDQWGKLGFPYAVQCGAWDRDFLTLASCRHLLMSNSTFSWWAAFLGKATKIVTPLEAGTMWRLGQERDADKDEYLNLWVDDEPGRWEFVNVA